VASSPRPSPSIIKEFGAHLAMRMMLYHLSGRGNFSAQAPQGHRSGQPCSPGPPSPSSRSLRPQSYSSYMSAISRVTPAVEC
jgi:hypothetical protein